MRRFTVKLINGDSVDVEAESIVLSTSYIQTTSTSEGQGEVIGTPKQIPLPVLEFNTRIKKESNAALMAQLNPGRPRTPGMDAEEQEKWVCVAAIFEPWTRVTSVAVDTETTTNE